MSFIFIQLIFQVVFTPINTILLYKVVGKDIEILGHRFGEKRSGFEITLLQSILFSAASAFIAGSALWYTPDLGLLLMSFLVYWMIVIYYCFQLPQDIALACAFLLVAVDDVIFTIVRYILLSIYG